ncbi:MAG: alpha/beta hydrolase [Dehalococcoidia bacterium]
MNKIYNTSKFLGFMAGAYIGISGILLKNLLRNDIISSPNTPNDINLGFKEISFINSFDGSKVPGWIIECSINSDNRPWIIIVPDKHTNMIDPTKGTLGIIKGLNKNQYNILIFDINSRESHNRNYKIIGESEQMQTIGAINFLKSELDVKENKIGLFGFGFGGSIAIITGSKFQNIGAIISDSAFADLEILWKYSLKGIKKTLHYFIPGAKILSSILLQNNISDISPYRYLSQSEIPIMIIHGLEDKIIPSEHGKMLARSSGYDFVENKSKNQKIILGNNIGHLDSFLTNPEKYIENINSFFEENLI